MRSVSSWTQWKGDCLPKCPCTRSASVHGGVGLRERLFLEITQFTTADRARAEKALALASTLHVRDQ